MSNAPSVDKKSSSKKVSVSFGGVWGGIAPFAVGSRKKKRIKHPMQLPVGAGCLRSWRRIAYSKDEYYS